MGVTISSRKCHGKLACFNKPLREHDGVAFCRECWCARKDDKSPQWDDLKRVDFYART